MYKKKFNKTVVRRLVSAITVVAYLCTSTVAFATPPSELPTPQPPEELSLNLDLRVTDIVEGGLAPFSGILLTSDAMTKIQYDHQLRLSVLQTRHQFELQSFQFRLTTETELRLSERQMHEEVFTSQLRRIEELENIALNQRPDWVLPVAILGAFIIGAGVTVGITYAVNQ